MTKRIAANQLGAALAMVAVDPDAIQAAIKPALADIDDGGTSSSRDAGASSRDRMCEEALFLRVFTFDYAAALTLGMWSKEKISLLDAYYHQLSEIAAKMAPLATGAADPFQGVLKKRLDSYTDAVNTPLLSAAQQENGAAWEVGKKFAEFCGHQEEFGTVAIGTILFGSSLKLACETIESYRVLT